MAALFSRVLFSNSIALQNRMTPFVQPVPHPDPGRHILILRTLTRLHNHGRTLEHPDSIAAFLFRQSDMAPIGGAVLDSVPNTHSADSRTGWDQQEFNFTPDGFVLAPQDSLLVTTAHEPRVGVLGNMISLNILLSWRRLSPSEVNELA